MVDKDTLLGGLVSVGLHGAVLVMLLITLPISTRSVQPDEVSVKLVPPPSVSQENKAAVSDKVVPEHKAFEAASNNEKENIKTELNRASEQQGSEKPQPIDGASQSLEDKEFGREPVLSTEKSSSSVATLTKQEAKMIKARKIYSKDALSNPRVKQALGKLSPKDRVIQICGIEALEQIRHHRPDMVPDMMARTGGALTESSLKMSGGAFRSRANWYNLDFDCTINPKDMAVSSFEYAIGDTIPKKDWSRRELPAD